MGFSVGNYAKIKEVKEVKENYTVVKLSFSKKNKATNEYETNFIGVARFVGNAHLQKPMVDQKIKITSCDVTNCYTKDGQMVFPERPQYVVFGYELQEGNGNASQPIKVEQALPIADDDDLPF